MHILRKMYKYRRGTSPTKRSVSTTTLSIQHGNLFILYYFSLSFSYLCSIINFLYVRDRMVYTCICRWCAQLTKRASPIRWRDMWRDFFHGVSLWRWRLSLLQQSDAGTILASNRWYGSAQQRKSACTIIASRSSSWIKRFFSVQFIIMDRSLYCILVASYLYLRFNGTV